MLNIERILQRETSQPFFSKYDVLKDRFCRQEQNYWLTNFPGGNDHGPGHIQRVLEHLDQLVGPNPVESELLNIYELYLAMMSVLYHDVGLLRGRDKHADTSGLLAGDDENYYIFQNWDLKIIRAVVVSHSSSKDIDQECAMFKDTVQVNQYHARPKVIAALLRLADELDEDSRRADKHVMEKLQLPATSEFFWQFCQRISGITADLKTLEIRIDAAFEKEDILRLTAIDSGARPFVLRFAEKLAKINSERVYLATFLPNDLRYKRLVVIVSPLRDHPNWVRPREFVFTDFTSAMEFVRAFPEMSRMPAAQLLTETLENIKIDNLEEALKNLSRLEELQSELPPDMVLQVFYDRACVESLRAAKLTRNKKQRDQLLDLASVYLEKWWTRGKQGAWLEVGRTSSNEIYRMRQDKDLGFLFSQRPIEKWIDSDLKNYLPSKPKKTASAAAVIKSVGGGGGGCIPYGCHVLTPDGSIPVENLRVGSEILSVRTTGGPKRLVARILNICTSREPRCVRLNGQAIFTTTQPLCTGPETYVNAGELHEGSTILDAELKAIKIESAVPCEGYYEVFSLTTDDPTHNFIAFNMICKNKMRLI